jgi:sigma-B regulation protein RsbQ
MLVIKRAGYCTAFANRRAGVVPRTVTAEPGGLETPVVGSRIVLWGGRAGHPSMSVIERNNVRVSGAGTQPMLFAHGFGCDQNMWRHVAPAFEAGYKVVLFDHVGAGGSDVRAYNKDKYGTLDGYARDVLEICQELPLSDVIFVGHSVAAMMGVLAARREPARFAKLVLVGPSPRYVNDGEYVGGFSREDIDGLLEALESNYLGWASTMAPMVVGNPDRPELGAELTNSFCRADPEIAAAFARVTFLSDNRADLADVTTPALILQCSQDMIAPEPVGQYVQRHLPGSRLVQMAATGHCPNLSAPAETIAAIRDFVGADR